MTTIDRLLHQLEAEKNTAASYNQFLNTTRGEPLLEKTLRQLQHKSNEKVELLEDTLQHMLEKEVW